MSRGWICILALACGKTEPGPVDTGTDGDSDTDTDSDTDADTDSDTDAAVSALQASCDYGTYGTGEPGPPVATAEVGVAHVGQSGIGGNCCDPWIVEVE